MSRATDAREKDRIGIFGTGLSYAGSYGRVTSESIGRDLNPLGRGKGQSLLAGTLNLGQILPWFPKSISFLGTGNSINNACSRYGIITNNIVPKPWRSCPIQYKSSPCENALMRLRAEQCTCRYFVCESISQPKRLVLGTTYGAEPDDGNCAAYRALKLYMATRHAYTMC